jgi:hypothetical protein
VVEDSCPAGYGIASAVAGQVEPFIYARWSIHHSRRATSSGVGDFFLAYAMRHRPSAISAVWGLAVAPERWHYRLVQGSIGPRRRRFRSAG